MVPVFFRNTTRIQRPLIQVIADKLSKSLEDIKRYSTELRKMEKTLRILTGEGCSEKKIVAMRNFSAVKQSLDETQKKIEELPKVETLMFAPRLKAVRRF